MKRRDEKEYFNNIIQEVKVENRLGLKKMSRMDIVDFEFIFTKISKSDILFSLRFSLRFEKIRTFSCIRNSI